MLREALQKLETIQVFVMLFYSHPNQTSELKNLWLVKVDKNYRIICWLMEKTLFQPLLVLSAHHCCVFLIRSGTTAVEFHSGNDRSGTN